MAFYDFHINRLIKTQFSKMYRTEQQMLSVTTTTITIIIIISSVGEELSLIALFSILFFWKDLYLVFPLHITTTIF